MNAPPPGNKSGVQMGPEKEGIQTPRSNRDYGGLFVAANIIAALIGLASGTLLVGLFFLWAMSSPVTGGTGHTPLWEIAFIGAMATIGLIFSFVGVAKARNCFTIGLAVFGFLLNGFVFGVVGVTGLIIIDQSRPAAAKDDYRPDNPNP